MTNPRINVAGIIQRDNQILLSEFANDLGIHYNFPGGGVDLNETLHEALTREVWEETRAKVKIGKLLAVWEYIPPNNDRYGNVHKIAHLFQCELLSDSEPRIPAELDRYQIGIRWVDLDKLHTIQIYPYLGDKLMTIIAGNLDNVFYGTIT